MRFLILSGLLCAVTTSTFAVDNAPLNYDVINIQTDASKEVNNDQMQAVLFIEKSSKQPSDLANQITLAMNKASQDRKSVV